MTGGVTDALSRPDRRAPGRPGTPASPTPAAEGRGPGWRRLSTWAGPTPWARWPHGPPRRWLCRPGIRSPASRWSCRPSPCRFSGTGGRRTNRRCPSAAKTQSPPCAPCWPWASSPVLFGPPGWRGAVASVSKEKAAELRAQVAAIAEASGLDVTVRRSPYPGAIESATGQLDTLSADRTAGHASGFDLVLIDETGLMPERARELLAGLRSSVSARDGRIIHISVRGDSPLFAEVLDNPATVAHVYAAPDGCAVDDETAWHLANPGIAAGIKSLAYMRKEVRRLEGAPADVPSFLAYDLNQSLDATREMVLTPDVLRACFVDDPPERAGPAFLGFDFGEATSATAAAAIWPASGRVETWMGLRRRSVAGRARQARQRALCRHGGPRRADDLSRARGAAGGLPGGPARRSRRRPREGRGGRLLQGFGGPRLHGSRRRALAGRVSPRRRREGRRPGRARLPAACPSAAPRHCGRTCPS